MTESQPEGSETTRNAMEEDLKPTNTPRERVRNYLQTSTNEKHWQAPLV